MNEIEISRHNFESANNRLKQFSEESDAVYAIESVKQDGGFLDMFAHKVTGEELNDRLSVIQDNFIRIYETNNEVIKEFREVYNTFDTLDKEYIAAIVSNVKALEKTSNDVRAQQSVLNQHNEKLETQQSKLDAHQAEIEKNVDNIKKIVEMLKKFKEKLDGYHHLEDVDSMWDECRSIKEELRVTSDSITLLSKNVDQKFNHIETILDDHANMLDDENKKSDIINKNQENIDAKTDAATQETNNIIKSLNNKIKYAYWVAGGAAGLAIIELLILLL